MAEPGRPWPVATATGVGPLPGTDADEAARVVLGEVGGLPHVPELPARGVGADAMGRTAALLVDIAVEVRAGRWRVTSRPGADQRRARDLLQRDLDALEEAGAGHDGPLKAQAVGPWALAAGLELADEGRLLADPGAVADLGASLAEGLAAHVAELRRRLPHATAVLVELDERGLADVVAGGVPTASGWGHLPAVEPGTVEELSRRVFAAVGTDVGVRLDDDGPLDVMHRAGARFAAMTADVVPNVDEDSIGEAVESGIGLMLGLVPPTAAGAAAELPLLARPARRLWRRLGFDPGVLTRDVVVTPAGGLAGVSPDQAVAVLARCQELASYLDEAPEEEEE